MSNLINEQLRQLCEDDPDLALILDVYEETERVYREALEAMGVASKHTIEVKNSAEVTISFGPPISSSEY